MTIEQYKAAACLAKILLDLRIIDIEMFMDTMERLGNG